MDCVIFDLDGTLVDTSPGIMESVKYAAEILGYPELSQEQLRTFIGPPLTESFMRCYGCDESHARKLKEVFRKHYREASLFNAKPYDGIITLCEKLSNRGCKIAVATSKPRVFAEQILNRFGFNIPIIHGADMEGKLKKSDLIKICVEETKALPAQCVMVGDTEYDAKGAQEAGVPFIGVSYGFGDSEEMRKYPSVGIVDKPMGILKILRESEEREHGTVGSGSVKFVHRT